MNTIEKEILVLKELVEEVGEYGDTVLTPEDIKALTKAIEALKDEASASKALEEAKASLPDDIMMQEMAGKCEGITIGQAEMIGRLYKNTIVPIVAKMIEKAKKGFFMRHHTKDEQLLIEKQKEIARLKKERDSYSDMYNQRFKEVAQLKSWINDHPEVKRLKKENEELRARLTYLDFMNEDSKIGKLSVEKALLQARLTLMEKRVGVKEIKNAMDSKEDYEGEAGYHSKKNQLCLGEILTSDNVEKLAQAISKSILGKEGEK